MTAAQQSPPFAQPLQELNFDLHMLLHPTRADMFLETNFLGRCIDLNTDSIESLNILSVTVRVLAYLSSVILSEE